MSNLPNAPPGDPGRPFQRMEGQPNIHQHTPILDETPRDDSFHIATSVSSDIPYIFQGARGQSNSNYQVQHAPSPMLAGTSRNANFNFHIAAPVPRNVAHIYRGGGFQLGGAYQHTPMLGQTMGNIGYHNMSGNFHNTTQGSNDAGYAFQEAGGQADNTYQHDPILGGVSGNIRGMYADGSSMSVNPGGNWAMQAARSLTGTSEFGGTFPVMSGSTAEPRPFGLIYEDFITNHSAAIPASLEPQGAQGVGNDRVDGGHLAVQRWNLVRHEASGETARLPNAWVRQTKTPLPEEIPKVRVHNDINASSERPWKGWELCILFNSSGLLPGDRPFRLFEINKSHLRQAIRRNRPYKNIIGMVVDDELQTSPIYAPSQDVLSTSIQGLLRNINFTTDILEVVLIGNIPIENFGSLPLLVFKWVSSSRIDEGFDQLGIVNEGSNRTGIKLLYPKDRTKIDDLLILTESSKFFHSDIVKQAKRKIGHIANEIGKAKSRKAKGKAKATGARQAAERNDKSKPSRLTYIRFKGDTLKQGDDAFEILLLPTSGFVKDMMCKITNVYAKTSDFKACMAPGADPAEYYHECFTTCKNYATSTFANVISQFIKGLFSSSKKATPEVLHQLLDDFTFSKEGGIDAPPGTPKYSSSLLHKAYHQLFIKRDRWFMSPNGDTENFGQASGITSFNPDQPGCPDGIIVITAAVGVNLSYLLPEEENQKLAPLQYRADVAADYERSCLPLADGSVSPIIKMHLTWNLPYNPNKASRSNDEDNNDDEDDEEGEGNNDDNDGEGEDNDGEGEYEYNADW